MSGRRVAFAAAAESLIGTPFRLHGRDPRTGLDCVGLVAEALRRVGAPVPVVPHYAIRQSDFAKQLEGVAAAGFQPAAGPIRAGDLLMLKPGPAQRHLAVAGPVGGLVHAHAGLGRAVRTPPPCPWPIVAHWRLRED